MFWAIHKITGAKINAFELLHIPDSIRREDIYYARAIDIKECPPETDINKIEIKFRNHCDVRGGENKPHYRRACFYIEKSKEKNISVRGESKSHKLLKELVWELFSEKKIEIIDVNGEKLNFEFDFSTLEIESVKSEREGKNIRGDIAIDFKEESTFYGKGIIVEVQLSSQYDYIEDRRTLSRALTGYSVTWLKRNDFFTEEGFLKDNAPKLTLNSCYAVLSEQKPKFLNDVRTACEYYTTLIDRKLIDEVNKAVERRMLHKCPLCGNYLKLREGKFGHFYGCNNYPNCLYKLGVKDGEQ